jgi:hypothetical protein
MYKEGYVLWNKSNKVTERKKTNRINNTLTKMKNNI